MGKSTDEMEQNIAQPTETAPTLTGSPQTVVDGHLARSTLLLLMYKYLTDNIHVKERLWTGAGSKGLNNLRKIEGKIPEELVEEVRSLDGPVTHHLERAVRLYLDVLKAGPS
ncbi:hypothetical protein ACFL2Q_00755 [Thermodesulfobacteriota bacterium]